MARTPKASPLLQAITDAAAKRAPSPVRVILAPEHLEAACRAYWETGGDPDDGPWASLPASGQAVVRKRVRAILAAVGLEVRD